MLDVWSQKSFEKRRKDTTSTDTTFGSTGGSADVSEDESLAVSNSECTDIREDQGHQTYTKLLKLSMCRNDDHWAYHPNVGTVLCVLAHMV